MMKVFVYGTLKQFRGNNIVMIEAGGWFLRPFMIPKEQGYCLYAAGIPFLVKSPSEATHVYGEIWEVEDIRPLDRLEGHPYWYERKEFTLPVNGEGDITFWAYTFDKERLKEYHTIVDRVPTGVF